MGVEGLRPIHVAIVDHDVLQVVYAYHELSKGKYFNRVDDMPKYIKYRVSTVSGNIAGDYKDSENRGCKWHDGNLSNGR